MKAIASAVGRLSYACGALAALAALALIGVTMYEVIARYAFKAPTLWAFDVAYMLNGASFILACALALQKSQHVSVDIIAQFFSNVWKRRIEVVVYTLLLFPVLGFICLSAWKETWKAFITGEIEQVSPWRPKIWPFQLILAVGLTALWLQVLARILHNHDSEEPAH